MKKDSQKRIGNGCVKKKSLGLLFSCN